MQDIGTNVKLINGIAPKKLPPGMDLFLALRETKKEAEVGYLLGALARAKGNRRLAALILGISQADLLLKLEHHGLKNYSKPARVKKSVTRIVVIRVASHSALAILPFSGKLRELTQRYIKQRLLLADNHIKKAALKLGVDWSTLYRKRAEFDEMLLDESQFLPFNGSLRELEHMYIQQVLMQTSFNKKAAAAVLGVSEKALYDKLYRYGIIQVQLAGA